MVQIRVKINTKTKIPILSRPVILFFGIGTDHVEVVKLYFFGPEKQTGGHFGVTSESWTDLVFISNPIKIH